MLDRRDLDAVIFNVIQEVVVLSKPIFDLKLIRICRNEALAIKWLVISVYLIKTDRIIGSIDQTWLYFAIQNIRNVYMSSILLEAFVFGIWKVRIGTFRHQWVALVVAKVWIHSSASVALLTICLWIHFQQSSVLIRGLYLSWFHLRTLALSFSK